MLISLSLYEHGSHISTKEIHYYKASVHHHNIIEYYLSTDNTTRNGSRLLPGLKVYLLTTSHFIRLRRDG
jgi:hypothetical protein